MCDSKALDEIDVFVVPRLRATYWSIGISFLNASVLTGPTWRVNDRPSHAYTEILEIEILPFQPGQFAAA
jgi:hypothetical protein